RTRAGQPGRVAGRRRRPAGGGRPNPAAVMRRAIAFLTPFGGAREPSPSALVWFPLVGALLGAALGVIWRVSDRLWYQGVSAALVIAADLAFTGMLHADGLVDSADGLLPPLASPERRLAVM